MELDFSAIYKYKDFFISGAMYTLFIAGIAVVGGTVIGMFLSILKLSKYKVLRFLSTAYIEIFRGTPILVQLYLVYLAFPSMFDIRMNPLTAGIIALCLNSGAYVAELIRAGIMAVDKGQMEAARSLGMPEWKAMYFIVIPQAIKNILPALANEFIVIIKESSIASVIGVTELMYNADTVRGNTFRPMESLLVAAVIYFMMTFTLSKIVAYFEGRMGDASSRKTS
ncbi:amino acid ABC transporter permease [uncultured Clostridium sp.]|uniref:amino acid ABC transporter permease n=1 Tax=uncultured Clostridium sp. TaxID=59620 RepID=UPI0026137455|nr:amino acid ABC transporter permease [uncultured Clostridium sp.]